MAGWMMLGCKCGEPKCPPHGCPMASVLGNAEFQCECCESCVEDCRAESEREDLVDE